MDIFFTNKNNAHTGEIKGIDGQVPRIGEVIEMPELKASNDGISSFLVIDVVYSAHNKTLVPTVICKASVGAINRNIELKGKGWLYTAADES